MIRALLFICLWFGPLAAHLTKTFYGFSPDAIDVVIPCHPKDAAGLDRCIKAIRKHGHNIRRVIVVSSQPLSHRAEWFDERKYPFTKEMILQEIFQGHPPKTAPRLGWVYQQLLKFYAFAVIPDLSPNILILDADTVFLAPTYFMTPTGEPFFNRGKEHYQPYFDHAKRLIPGFQKVFPKYSGITHHMLFQRPILEDLFQQIVDVHALEPWKAILRCVDLKQFDKACLSEYEIYFNFAFMRTDQAHLRKLKWANIKSLDAIKKYREDGYDYVSCHLFE
jgi:hypothetical protein